MIDLHTHLLWDWDDGPDDRRQALEMVRIAERDGIMAIALTPHVFRLTRHNGDLAILRQRMLEFQDAMAEARVGIEFHWGAEVAVHAELVRSIERFGFTLDATSYVFLEFPSESVPPGSSSLIYSLMSKGFVPIISHPERNRGFMAHPELLYEFISMGCAAQVTAMSLTGEFGRETRASAGLFLVHNLVHIIASDAHSSLSRPPVLSRAVAAAARIVGQERAMAMVTDVPRAILANVALPDWGEPANPLARRTWTEKLFSGKKT